MDTNHKQQSIQALAKLRGLVEAQKITHEVLAEKLGIRRQTVGQVLSGKFHPTLDNLFRYLNAMNELTGMKYGLIDLTEK